MAAAALEDERDGGVALDGDRLHLRRAGRGLGDDDRARQAVAPVAQREGSRRARARERQDGGDESRRATAGALNTRRLVVRGKGNEARGRVVLQQRLAQAAHESLGASRPGVGALGKGAKEHGVDRRGQARIQLGCAGRRFGGMEHRLGRRGIGLERAASRQQLESHAAERVPVAGGCGGLAASLLGRHVPRATQDRARRRQRIVRGGARDAEIGDVHLPVVVEQEVAGLHVPVDDAGGMRGVERAGGLVEPGDRRVVRHSAFTKTIRKGSAAQVFHDDERRPVGLADVEDRHNVGMGERGGGQGLAREARAELVVRRVAVGQHLDGDDAAQDRIGRTVDVSHATAGHEVDAHIARGQAARPQARHDGTVPPEATP